MVWLLAETVLRRTVRLSMRVDTQRMAELHLDECKEFLDGFQMVWCLYTLLQTA